MYTRALNLGCTAGNRSSPSPGGAMEVSPVPTPSSCGAQESHPHCQAPGQAHIWPFASALGLRSFSRFHSTLTCPGVPQEGPALPTCSKAAVLTPSASCQGSCAGALLAEGSLLLHWTWISAVCHGERYFCSSLLWVSWSFAFICRQGNTRVFSPCSLMSAFLFP